MECGRDDQARQSQMNDVNDPAAIRDRFVRCLDMRLVLRIDDERPCFTIFLSARIPQRLTLEEG